MAEEKWVVAVDGNQLEGDYDISQIRQLLSQHAGKQVVVWNESMPSWSDPRSLPQFRPPAASGAPRPAAGPAPSAAPPAAAGPSLEAQAAARAQAMRETVQQDAKFFKGLIDPSFDTLITPKIIRTLYMIAMVAVALGAIFFLLSGIKTFFSGIRFGFGGIAITGLVMVVLAPVVGIVYLALMRVSFEIAITLFKIKDYVQQIAERAEKK